MSFTEDIEKPSEDSHTEAINIHAKTKVAHLNRQLHTQRAYIKHLEQEKEALEAEVGRLKRSISSRKAAFTTLKSRLRGAAAATLGVASIIHPDFIPL